HLWAQADSLGYYAEDWEPGDLAINDQRLRIPSQAPPIAMQLLFGLYSPGTGQRQPLRDASGRDAGTELALGSVAIQSARGLDPGWRPQHPVNREVVPGL